MNPRSPVSALASLALLLAVVRPAFAGDSAPTPTSSSARTSGIVGEAERWITAAAAGPVVASEPTAHGVATPTSRTAERDAPPYGAGAERRALVELVPSLSLVARDWRGSVKIMGHRTMLVDELRPTASNRMVVARLATGGRLTTFGQLGVGEWRIDTVMFPNTRAYSEAAAQIGGGFELALTPSVRVAGEAQYTVLYRDLTYTSDEVAPRMLAFVVAIDGRF